MSAKDTTRVEVTKGHSLGGVGNDVRPGQILAVPGDLDPLKARHMVRRGWGRWVPAEKPQKASGGPPRAEDRVEVRDPAVEHRDPDIGTHETPPKPGPKAKKKSRSKRKKKS